MATKRTPIEESMLLPSPLKIGVIIVTFLFELFQNFALEQAAGTILVFIALCVLFASWWRSSSLLRTIGSMFLTIGCLLPWALAPESLNLTPLPAFNRFDPPTFPVAGRVLRHDLLINGEDGWFREKQSPNRIILMRGVNFGASVKIPSEKDATHIKEADFYSKHTTVSFVSRPCPLEECDEHLARLASWGFNVLRLLITWEAVEHKGPRQYDFEYLTYLRELSRKANKHGLSIFVDPHQDVWSRYTGGDGAPGWTLEKVGFKLGSELYETGATLTHQEHGDPFPRMSWPTNYARLACATMFTLFFAGDDFAPKTRIDGVSAQEYLQGHYIQAMKQVAKALKDEPNVLGFDSLNEPGNGYVGLDDLRLSIFPIPMAYQISAYEGMILGAGFSRRIDLFQLPFIFNKTELLNPHKKSVWQSPDKDVWRANGVWDIGADMQPRLLRPGHFKLPPGASFVKRYMLPFFNKMAQAIREEASDMVLFAEPHIEPRQPVHQAAPAKEMKDQSGGNLAWVPHFYDGATLVTKSYRSWFALDAEHGMINVGNYFTRQVFKRAATGLRRSGNGLPVLVGETGVPMDMGSRMSFESGDFSLQISALDRVLRAMEAEFLSWTLWTYAYDNSNARGDLWNGEDLSLWSRDQVKDVNDLNSGGRALEAAVRPYPMKIAGIPLETWFEPLDLRKTFYLKVRLLVADQAKGLETVLFIPKLQYPKGIQWRVGGKGSSMLRVGQVNGTDQGYYWKHDVTPGATSVDDDEVFVDQWVEIQAKV